MATPAAMALPGAKEWALPAGSELRFEVDPGRAVGLRLLAGTAECAGVELPLGASQPTRVVGPAKLALFTYDGARIAIAPVEVLPGERPGPAGLMGGCSVAYTSPEGNAAMHALLNVHRALEDLRSRAAQAPQAHAPPRVLVLGIGRNTATRILCNYAVRAGRRAMLVDADPSSGSVLIPGVLAAHVLSRTLNPEDGFWGASSGEGQPVSYFFGNTSPSAGPQWASHYRALLGRLAHAANGRLAAAPAGCDAGAIIVGPSGANSALAAEMQAAFKASVVVVVGDERLYATVEQTLVPTPERQLAVVHVPRSGGHVVRDAAFRQVLAQWQFSRYFNGASGEYAPFTVHLHWDELSVRRLAQPGDEELLAPTSALPLGATRKVQAASAAAGRTVALGTHLVHAILAVPWVPPPADDKDAPSDVLEANCAGFLHVSSVDEEHRTLSVLSTCPAPTAPTGQQHISAGMRLLPSPYLIQGALRWDFS